MFKYLSLFLVMNLLSCRKVTLDKTLDKSESSQCDNLLSYAKLDEIIGTDHYKNQSLGKLLGDLKFIKVQKSDLLIIAQKCEEAYHKHYPYKNSNYRGKPSKLSSRLCEINGNKILIMNPGPRSEGALFFFLIKNEKVVQWSYRRYARNVKD